MKPFIKMRGKSSPPNPGRSSFRKRLGKTKNHKDEIEDIVIAVMGVTGAGKSTFISTVTGEAQAKVGHDLYSETSEVSSYRFSQDGRTYILVDTPGFDDSTMSNEEVMTKIVTWLESTYRKGQRLNGIIYIHNITKSRMQGSAFQNIRMFRALCGSDALQNVILATSFWDQVDATVGEGREKKLIEAKEFWADMITKGAEVVRLKPERSVCIEVVQRFANKSQVGLSVQREIVDKKKKLEDTAVGKASANSKAIAKAEKELKVRRAKEMKQMQAKRKATEKAQDKQLRRARKQDQRRLRKQRRQFRTQKVQEDFKLFAEKVRRKLGRAWIQIKLWDVQLDERNMAARQRMQEKRMERKIAYQRYSLYPRR